MNDCDRLGEPLMPSPERVQTVADAIHLSHCGYGADNLDLCCCPDNLLPRWLQYAEAAIAASDAMRPKLAEISDVQIEAFNVAKETARRNWEKINNTLCPLGNHEVHNTFVKAGLEAYEASRKARAK